MRSTESVPKVASRGAVGHEADDDHLGEVTRAARADHHDAAVRLHRDPARER
jgi:hypothetical protein